MSENNVVKTKAVPLNSLKLDCTKLSDILIDLSPGELVGKRTTQDGYHEAVHEILSNQESWGNVTGITQEDINTLVSADEQIELIDQQLPAARKLVEILEESRATIDDVRHRRVSEIAAVVDARSKLRNNTELLARYEKTREYRSASAMKAVRTRRKNEELAGEEVLPVSPAESQPVPPVEA